MATTQFIPVSELLPVTVPSKVKLTRKHGRVVVPGAQCGLLSKPSKMPCKSFSIPAKKSCPFAWGSICDSCYADDRGMYHFDNVKDAQQARMNWTVLSMRTAQGRTNWIRVMVATIGKAKYFRVHDSGDMFNVHYVECWYEVCKALPNCRFWIPTRVWQFHGVPLADTHPMLVAIRKLATLANVTVRPSALDFGAEPPVVPGLAAGSTSENANVFPCPAHLQGNQCGPCRHCWENKTEPVSYEKH